MQFYTRKDILEIVKPDPSWMNFDVPVTYEKKTIPLKEVIETLYSVWDDIEDFERVSFMEYAKAFKDNVISDIPQERKQKIFEIYNNKFIDTELMVPCFICKDLKILLPEEYPQNMKTPHSVYIAEDRNHRLVALALRILDGENLEEIPVTVFFGHIA